MGKWLKYQAPDSNHPCTNCQSGWGGQSHKVVDGIDYYRNDSCDETCERLREYNKAPEERWFGGDIREAIGAIKGIKD